jgi:hypothetical protein
MLNKFFLIWAALLLFTFTGFSRPVKVTFSYDLADVTLVYNDQVFKQCPKELPVDFQLGGQLIAFKSGYESRIMRISKDSLFTSCHIQLVPLQNKFTGRNLQVELEKVSFINYVTNFTPEEVALLMITKLNNCNILTHGQNSIFTGVNANSRRFSIGAEVIKSVSKNAAYTAPYYLFSHQKIRWFVLDNTSNQILLELTTEGFYLAYFKAKKGMVASDRLKEITVLSLEEATQKFVNSSQLATLASQANNK